MGKAKSKIKYIIGVDLGTTNCTMAYTKVEAVQPKDSHSASEITQFDIPQVVTAGTQKTHSSLPSFVYFPLPEELSAKVTGIKWDLDRLHCTGTFARDRGAELPGRMISSAKSWLCHDGINRREKIFPQDVSEDSEKMSPVDACAELLRHLREAWDHTQPEAPFEEQTILVTVPASFDPGARQLVQEAATLASYPEIILMEEPQAAFYAWLHRQGTEWRKQLTVGDRVLVVDIGGGTTDFSLITVVDQEGDLGLQRTAVGSHLLLGGDNIDLALAYLVKNKLEAEGHTIDQWQLQGLIHACRQAKETLMGDRPPKSVDVAIHGRGSKLIGGTLKASITQAEAHSLLVDGFIPLVGPEEQSRIERRLGIQRVGLPYAQDPRVSSQLAKFLSMTGEADSNSTASFVMPTAILFNGGTMKAKALRERIVELLNSWAKIQGSPPIKELPEPDYDHAVSQGAVYYGLSRLGQALRIRGGTSHSYYVGVEESIPAVPGMPPPMKAVCVVPFGMEEGTEAQLEHQQFALLLGEQATFRFFSRSTPQLSNGQEPNIGTVVPHWQKELKELHPIETALEKGASDGKTVRVSLSSKVTELGVLELWCVADDGRKWKLEFDECRMTNAE